MTSRRQFIERTSALAAVAAMGACDAFPEWRSLLSASDDASFAVPTGTAVDRVTHTLSRLSYGIRPGERARVRGLGGTEQSAVDAYLDEQLSPQSADPTAERHIRRLEALAEPPGELYEFQPSLLRDQMAAAAMLRAVYGERQLYEVMVGFWTDHFNIDVSKGDCRWLLPAHDRDVIRRHALGRFADLLRAVVLSPAMLWYLDGRVNRRATSLEQPNENYARELLELHALGVDAGYTQRDVMEVARALTGWTVRSRGDSRFGIGAVEFHADLHDDEQKTVLGSVIAAGQGRHDVDALVRIVTEHPACATFVADKLCRRFIADAPPRQVVTAVAQTFRATRGDVPATLRTLFASSEFQSARGTRFKRPFHFLASALRATSAETDAGPPLIAWLERMGHAPFQYPTPDGYPNEAAPWVGTLLWRWQFAAALTAGHIEGTSVNFEALSRRAGSDEALHAHLIGRAPSAHELAAARSSGNAVALALSSPAFQLT